MMRGSGVEVGDERHRSRREVLASSLKLIGAGTVVAASSFGPARVAAQDEGMGAGGREGGDDESTGTLPAAEGDGEGMGAGGRQEGDGGGRQEGDGGGRRRRQDDGVGGSGRSDAPPSVMAMPHTGVGVGEGGMAPLLLAAGAVGAAAMAMKMRSMSAAQAKTGPAGGASTDPR